MRPMSALSAALATAALAAATLLPQTAAAQAQPTQPWPSRPVRIVSAFSVGSGPDVMLRAVAERLSRTWNQPVVVENRPGGAGFIAIGEGRNAAPDGYTLLHVDALNATAVPHLYKKLPYDAEGDLRPISPIHGSFFFVVVGADSPYKTIGDLLAAARRKPDGLTYGSWQVGSVAHLGGAALEKAAGVKMQHVPFRENSQLYSNVATGQVDWAFGSLASTMALEKSGKLRYLAIAGPGRDPARPEVPTVAESGGPRSFETYSWIGLFAPRGVPAAVVDKVGQDLGRVLAEPAVQSRMADVGYTPTPLRPEQTAALIAREARSYGETIRGAGISLD